MAPGPVSVNFGDSAMRHRRRGGQNELLGRAVGCGRKPQLSVLDATAGLGRDSFVLADLGCRVQMCERDPVIATLLASGLEQARMASDAWLSYTSERLSLWEGVAQELPIPLRQSIDTIYLDPMFPGRDKTAAVKKEMAVFQRYLAGSAAADQKGETEALLHWALEQPVARVVLKRPPKAPLLADCKPSHQIVGKAVRFDVFVLSAFS